MRDLIKFVLTGTFLYALLVGGLYATFKAEEQAQAQRRQQQELAIEQLQKTDLQPLYEQINIQNFGDELPHDTIVVWQDLNGNLNPNCQNACGGWTELNTGKPLRIVVNKATVKTDSRMLEVLRHEMCHVAVSQAGQYDDKDMHGPPFQECMKRFQ